ncbi:MAG: glucose 1-dehydrogenase [Acidobacteriota bacterium]
MKEPKLDSPALPSLRLDGQVALVTGTGSGLGQAISLALAEAGADLIITETPGRLDGAKVTAQGIRARGREALVLPLNVTSVKSIERMTERAIRRFSKIDVLVNNAGINIAQPALEVTEKQWDEVLSVNLKGVFFCSQIVGREMVKRKSGKIINIASQNGVIGYYKRAAYCASKAGVVNLTRVLALEWAPYHINVNAVGPTFILTPLTEKFFQDRQFSKEILQRIPLGRLGQPQDVTGAVVFLASPAAALITGHTLLVDGGWTAL